MGKPRSVRSRKTDTHNRGHSSQYESETEDSEVNTLYTTDDETCHSGSDQVYEATHDLSNIETEEEEETIVLRPRSKLNITSASECDETDDEVFSDACSDIDTNSIDTDVITQSKRSKSKLAYSNRHAKIRQEDLLQRFLMGLLDNEARIHIELTKDPKTIEEAVQEVITYRETTSETQEGNSGKNNKVRQLKKQNNQSSQKSDQTVEKKQNTNFNKQGSTNTENDVISVTKDEL
ncbi:unnamed protein product [Mytilus coruscus]|uniref:Uncharacterized protein n=1 Tax=Mytilus coruscus TaxID=42192 RepID=A0A6J8C7T9_MYTCO|nr:unnamed protein product [Mytilus coruscus]